MTYLNYCLVIPAGKYKHRVQMREKMSQIRASHRQNMPRRLRMEWRRRFDVCGHHSDVGRSPSGLGEGFGGDVIPSATFGQVKCHQAVPCIYLSTLK